MPLELLLAHADDGSPILSEGLPSRLAALGPPAPPPVYPRRLRDDAVDPQSLERQQWGIIAPEGSLGDHLLELVKPLRRAREAQQNREARVYRVAARMDPLAAAAW